MALGGQEFVLPDLILLNLSRRDISQPDDFPDVAQAWKPVLPAYRRLYPILDVFTYFPGITSPGNIPAGDNNSILISSDSEFSSKPFDSVQHKHLTAHTEINIREGMDTSLKIRFPEIGDFEGILFFPFPESSPRPLSGEIFFSRSGMVSADIRLGIKNDKGVVPYSTGHLDWNGGILRPDSYYLDILTYGIQESGLSVDTGIKLDYSIGDSQWSIYTDIEGGGWYSEYNSNGFLRTAVAAGFRWPAKRISIKAGADVIYHGNRGLQGLPFLSIQWLPITGLSVFADSSLDIGFTDAVDTAFRRERLALFNPEIPFNSDFRVGIAHSSNAGLSYNIDVSYRYGFFSTAVDGDVLSIQDKRISGTAEIVYKYGFQKIELSGFWNISVEGNPYLWDVRLGYSVNTIDIYASGGTEDAILSGYLPGVRGEQPIIGTGIIWNLSEDWEIEAFTYTEIPWNNPSLRISLNWSN